MQSVQRYPAKFNSGSVVDYGRNWGNDEDDNPGFLYEGETIRESTWTITSDKERVPTLIESAQGTGISTDGQVTSIFLTGGTPGIVYKLTNHITTQKDGSYVRKQSKSGLIFCC